MPSNTTLASLAVEITADTSKLRQSMSQAVRAASNSGDSTGRAFGTAFASPALQAIGRVRSALGTVQDVLSLGAAVTALRVAASYRQVTAGFEGLTGSAKLAGDMMDRLSRIGANSPFNTAALSASARQMLASGVAARSMADDVQALADVAAHFGGNTETFQRLAEITSGLNYQRAVGIDTAQSLGGLGINLGELIGRANGTAALSPQNAINRIAGMRGDVVREMLLRGARTYKGEAARMATRTPEGLAQNAQENVALALKPTGDLVLNTLMRIAPGFISAAQAMGHFNQATGGTAGLIAILTGGAIAVSRMSVAVTTGRAAVDSLTGAIIKMGAAAELIATRLPAGGAGAAAASAAGRSVVLGPNGEAYIPAAGAAGTAATGFKGLIAPKGNIWSRGLNMAPRGVTTIGRGAGAAGGAGGLLKGLGGGILSFAPLLVGLGASYAADNLTASGHPGYANTARGIARGIGTGSLIGMGVGALIGGLVGIAGGPAGIIAGVLAGARIGGLAGGAIGGIVGGYQGAHEQMPSDMKRAADAAEKTAANSDKMVGVLTRMDNRSVGGGQRTSAAMGVLEFQFALMRSV